MHEYMKMVHDTTYGIPYLVKVNKVGGGTVGNLYSREEWEVSIYDETCSRVWSSDELYIGVAATHEDAAYIAMNWFEGE